MDSPMNDKVAKTIRETTQMEPGVGYISDEATDKY